VHTKIELYASALQLGFSSGDQLKVTPKH